MSVIVFDQASAKKLAHNLTELPRRVAIKHLRIGLNAWGGVVRDEARRRVRKATKLLDKSLSVKVTIPDASRNAAHHGKPARAMVGANRKVKRPVVRKRGGGFRAITEKRAANIRADGGNVNRYQKPSRYAHLVEAKTPFIAPAQEAGATAGFQKMATKIEQGLAAEAAALPK